MLFVIMMILSHLVATNGQIVSCYTNFVEDDVAAEGDIVTYSCSTTYTGSHNASLVWYDEQGWKVTNETFPTRGPLGLTYANITYVPTIPTLTCKLYEWILGKGWSFTNQTCDTKELNILYSVRNIAIRPFLFASPGEELSCEAEGNPDPAYLWIKSEDGGVWVNASETDEFNEDYDKVTAELSENSTSAIYKCLARNTIRGLSYTIESAGIEVTVGGATKRWIILGSVLGGAAAIAIIVAIVYFVCLG